MIVDLSKLELHNLRRTATGELRTRRAWESYGITLALNTVFVGGFSVESPGTGDPWHYVFTQATGTGLVTLTVYTEEGVSMFTHSLGFMAGRPVFTYATANAQLMINSPQLSAPLYGLPGGGLITAVKQDSINPDTTAIDIPAGHICSFGDRFPIASGNVLFFNDPPSGNAVDPRTYVAENAVALPGIIYDICQGPDGNLYIFTSAGAYVLPRDALAQGQLVSGSLQRITGVETTRPKNAVATEGTVAVLQKDSVVLLPSGRVVPIARRGARRYFSGAVEREDLRVSAELYPIPRGFIVTLRGGRSSRYLEIDSTGERVSYMTLPSSSDAIVGVLRGRDGEAIIITKNTSMVDYSRKRSDTLGLGNPIVGVAAGRVASVADDRAVVEHVTLSADNIALANGCYVSGTAKTSTTPTKTDDFIVGTDVWAATGQFYGGGTRTTRLPVGVRTSEIALEVTITGGDRRLLPSALVEVSGQEPSRKERP